MDEIIYLEPDEEITSVIDKIKKAPSTNLGLVIPRDATLLQSVVNLRLLSREANSLGKKISVVTSDKIGRNLAAQIGLPVFASIEEQKPIFSPRGPEISTDEVLEVNPPEEKPLENNADIPGVKVQQYQSNQNSSKPNPVLWKRHEKPTISPSLSTSSVKHILNKKDTDYKKLHKILWPILGVFIILSAVATFLLLPKATVTVFIPSTDLKKTLTLAVSDQVKQSNLEQNVFPGTLVESSGDKTAKFTATGKKDIGTKTKGKIVLKNDFDSNNHNIPAGSQLTSSSKTFLTQTAVTIPPATISNMKPVSGTVSVEIEAENPGADYNIKAGRFSILSLSAAQQSGIYGQSLNDLIGGESRQVQVVSQKDYDDAKNSLVKDLTDSVGKDIQKKIGSKKLIEKALVVSDPEVTSSAKVDGEATDFDMTVKLKNQALVYTDSEFQNFIIKIVSKDLSSDKKVTIAKSEDLNLTVDKTAYDKGQMDLTVNVLVKVSDEVSTDKIKQAVLGKKVSEISGIIKNLSGITRVEVSQQPSWWFKRLPDLEGNINVKTEYLNSEQVKP